MPVYQISGPIPSVYPGDQILLIGSLPSPSSPMSAAVGETKGTLAATTGVLSQQVALAGPYLGEEVQLSIELTFSANPGAFEFDIQDADTDDGQHYLTVPTSGVINAASVSPNGLLWIARSELVPIKGSCVALFCTTQPANACTVIAKLTR